jgi:outer membrane protein insertion porin family
MSDASLKKTFKNTKQRNPIRIFKKSKYIKEKYKEDLVAVIDKYKEKANRDRFILPEDRDICFFINITTFLTSSAI